MIYVMGQFTWVEEVIVFSIKERLKKCFSDMPCYGGVHPFGEMIEFRACIGAEEDNEEDLFVLRFGVNETSADGTKDYVYVPSIVIPSKCRGKGIATSILRSISKVSKDLNLGCIIKVGENQRFKNHLLRIGGIEREDGNVELQYDNLCKTVGKTI